MKISSLNYTYTEPSRRKFWNLAGLCVYEEVNWISWYPPHPITTTNYAKISGQNCNISQEICTPGEVNILYYSLCITTIGGHWHRSQCQRYPTSDIDICYSDIGDKYVGLKNVIPISEVFRYQKCSDIDIRAHSDIEEKNISSCRIESTSLGTLSERYNTKLLCLSICI